MYLTHNQETFFLPFAIAINNTSPQVPAMAVDDRNAAQPAASRPYIPINFWQTTMLTTNPKAAAIIKRYYIRPEFEFFDLDKDPLELNNLADNPEYKENLAKLRAELSTWTTAQGDELLPHRDPYLTSAPLPKLTPAPKKVKTKRKSKKNRKKSK